MMNITEINNLSIIRTDYIEGFTKIPKKPTLRYTLARKGDVFYAGYSKYIDYYPEYYSITLGNFFKRIIGSGIITARVDHYRDEAKMGICDIGKFTDSKTYYEEIYNENNEPNHYPVFFYPYVEIKMISGQTYYIMTQKEEQLNEVINIAKRKNEYIWCYDKPKRCTYITNTLDILELTE